MEIFTFLHMGGDLERIEIRLLLASAAEGRSDRQASRDRLTAQFATFDAAKAQCSLNKDRQRLLAVVEAGFGDVKRFNIKMRNVFESRLVGSSRGGTSRVGSSRGGRSRRGSSRGGSKRVTPAEAYKASDVDAPAAADLFIMSETPAAAAALAGARGGGV